MSAKPRRLPGEGAIYQRHDHPTCPPRTAHGARPAHRCKGRWVGSYEIRTGVNTRARRVVYGRTRGEVRDKLRAVQLAQASGGPSDRALTVGECVERWLDVSLPVSGRKASTSLTYSALLRTHVLPDVLALRPLAEVEACDIEAWLSRLGQGARRRPLAEATVRQIFTVLQMVFDTALRDGLISRNPVAAVRRPKVAHREARYLSLPELEQLLDATRDSHLAPLFRFIASTGLRKGEALALTWTDVDLDRQQVHVRGTLSRMPGGLEVTTPKSERSRRLVPLGDGALAALREAKAAGASARLRAGGASNDARFVFTTELGKPLDPRNVLRALQTAAGEVGLEGVSIHTLRHTSATLMLNNGSPIHAVSRLLGHSSISITADLYGHLATEEARLVMQSLSETISPAKRVNSKHS